MPYTIAELRAALEELGEGESLYFQSYGVTFALKAGAVVETEEGFELYGRIVTAEPRAGTSAPVAAMWAGVLGGKDVFLAACNDMIYSLYDADSGVFSASALAGETVRTDKGVSFFQFDGIVYILNGYEYYKYDGVEVIRVEGYRPLVAITIGPQGTGEAGELTGEFVNRLNGNRRVWISPDGTGTVFQLPEKNLAAVDYVKDLASGEDLPGAGYTADLTAGTVTFSTAPARAVNSIEIGYSVSETYRSQVTGMLFSEFYSGTTDTRIPPAEGGLLPGSVRGAGGGREHAHHEHDPALRKPHRLQAHGMLGASTRRGGTGNRRPDAEHLLHPGEPGERQHGSGAGGAGEQLPGDGVRNGALPVDEFLVLHEQSDEG